MREGRATANGKGISPCIKPHFLVSDCFLFLGRVTVDGREIPPCRFEPHFLVFDCSLFLGRVTVNGKEIEPHFLVFDCFLFLGSATVGGKETPGVPASGRTFWFPTASLSQAVSLLTAEKSHTASNRTSSCLMYSSPGPCHH